LDIYKASRRLDFDRTLAANLAKAPEALYALNVYNAELGNIRAKVSDPITFEIRLMWWRDAMDDLEKRKVRKHPLVEALYKHTIKNSLFEDMLALMAEHRFSEFQETAPNFKEFVESRRYFLQPYYLNTVIAFEGDEDDDDCSAFVALDLLSTLQNLEFYRVRGIQLFEGPVELGAIEALLNKNPKTKYFKSLKILAGYNFKHLKKVGFGEKINLARPGKILKLWLS